MAQDANLYPELYPFSTQDGKSIPLDIIRPAGLIIQSFTASGNTFLESSTPLDVAVFMASKPCLVGFGEEVPNPAVNGEFYSNSLIIPAGVIITVKCPSSIMYIRGTDEAGTLYVQAIHRWAGLSLPSQLFRK
jgi:hypothetical protein